MRSLFLLPVVVFFAATSGCGSSSPCAGVSGACIGAHVKGNATNLQQLVIAIDQPTPETVLSPSAPAPIKLPARVALVLPAGTTGAVHVSIDGVDGNNSPVAHDERTVTLPASGHVDVDFTLDSGSGGAGSGGDGGGEPDLATGIVLNGATDHSVFELEPLSVSFDASDPLSTDLELSATGVPATATFTASGATATLTWTPTNVEAGDYPITLTATSASDPSRTGSQPFVVHVKNTNDPMLNPFGVSPDQLVLSPVGDVDGDGIADFAFCTINIQPSVPAQYSVQLIYGDKSGLPTARPYPTARTRAITFAGPAGSNDGTSAFNFTASCTGGDVDGDGHSDVVIADPFYVPSGTTQTGTYWVVYGTARSSTAAPVLLQLTGSGTDTVGNDLVAGDWNGDGLVDFASTQSNGASAGPGVTENIYIWKGAFPRATGTVAGQVFAEGHLCGNLSLVGFAAHNGANGPGGKKAHPLVWYNPAVASDGSLPTTGTCGATNGGLRVLTAGVQINGFMGLSLPQSFAPPLAICDVDGDGKDDLLVLIRDMTSGKWTSSVTYGAAGGWTSPVDLSKSLLTPVAGSAPRQACWPSAFGPGRFVVSDPGNLTSQGFLGPGTVYFFDVNASKVPVLTKTLTNFSTDMNFTGFGAALATPGDIDGDGKPELVISYQSAFSGPRFAWTVYGR
jgi:hypothetical protein